MRQPNWEQRDEDILAGEAHKIAVALALLQDQLPLLGRDGRAAEHQLTSAINILEGEEGPRSARRDAFRAFQLGFKTKEEMAPTSGATLPAWSRDEGLTLPYEAGGSAAHLNRMARKGKSLFRQARSGPLDGSEPRAVLADAMLAVTTSGQRLRDDNR